MALTYSTSGSGTKHSLLMSKGRVWASRRSLSDFLRKEAATPNSAMRMSPDIVKAVNREHAALPLPDDVLQLVFTNLRNRPLSEDTLDPMGGSVMS
ncbi:hypothetical protein EYF80_032188 [Liparis tanakae]|uniref:Uncharacterized protein n=1 Tax=Liparis tanakae TaxID=230148 RepID=A0A4Z2GVM7_9TELE|nr:hypothetical protein EYF80_032188 [Liparis tanakae]